MIRHFQRKFIYVSTCALIIVLLTIITSISSIAYYRSKTEVNQVLTMLIKNDGQLRGNDVNRQPQSFFNPRLTKEGVYQYRYFSAKVDKKSQQIHVNNDHIITVSPSVIMSFANTVDKRHRNNGYVFYQGTTYAYRIKRTKKMDTIVFLDESLLMSEAKEILKVSMVLGITGLILFTVILITFSKRAIKPIIEAEDRQHEFITNAGHELKTPLTVISANTEMQELTTGETEWTKSNKVQVTRLTRLINNLISLARTEEQDKTTISLIHISDLTQNAANNFKSVALQEDKNFEILIQPDLKAMGEDNRYEELVNILLDNAIKYCDEQGTIRLVLQKLPHSKNSQLIISNSYKDGKDVDYKKFFDRFYRADTSHTNDNGKKGFGIGLSMAQQIVNSFKGKIRADYSHEMIHFKVILRG